MSMHQETPLPSAPAGFFDPERRLFSSRAPGRLDVMGGVSDYSGGMCLEWPLLCATCCTVQLTDDGQVEVQSAAGEGEGWQARVQVPLVTLLTTPAGELRQRVLNQPEQRWALYVLGCISLLAQENQGHWPAGSGARLWITSDVPLAAGVSSSAALEVASMSALCKALQCNLDPVALARLCQRVENTVVGAPCGLMDQLTCGLGRENHLLSLNCQPDLITGHLPLPPEVEVWAINSNVKHSIGGSAYSNARCATFMGRRILQDLLPHAMAGPDGNDYLCNLTPDVWRALRHVIPEQLSGEEFLRRYGTHGDAATTVDPDLIYGIRLATEHPILERDRVGRFAHLLQLAATNEGARPDLLDRAGALMVQTHCSYNHRLNLGSAETDLLVELALQAGAVNGILGAKITGGGSGGSVAILADRRRQPRLEAIIHDIAAAYTARTGISAAVFTGSSPGAFTIQ